MRKTTTLFAAGLCAAASLALSASALAGSATPPSNMQNAAENYIGSRLADAKGARYWAASQPYPVVAELSSGKEYDCWALDVRVRSDAVGTGTFADTYTVLFHNNRAVALKRDLRQQIVRVQSVDRYAAN